MALVREFLSTDMTLVHDGLLIVSSPGMKNITDTRLMYSLKTIFLFPILTTLCLSTLLKGHEQYVQYT